MTAALSILTLLLHLQTFSAQAHECPSQGSKTWLFDQLNNAKTVDVKRISSFDCSQDTMDRNQHLCEVIALSPTGPLTLLASPEVVSPFMVTPPLFEAVDLKISVGPNHDGANEIYLVYSADDRLLSKKISFCN